MQSFLQRFGGLVLGILSGFDRLVLRGTLPQLYGPEGMHAYLGANHVLGKDFDAHAQSVTRQLLDASLIAQAKEGGYFRYLNSSRINKDQQARQIAQQRGNPEGLACVLQCVEPCYSFSVQSQQGELRVRGQERRCSHLYHYYRDPQFGWMFVRLQTWFPFEMLVYVNGREWLCRQMDQAGLAYRRSDNKVLWTQDWSRAQALADAQLQINWVKELDALQARVHPLHPTHLGKLPLRYNWTVHQSEWATDLAFGQREDLRKYYEPWLRQQLLSGNGATVLRYFGHSGRPRTGKEAKTELREFAEGLRIKHWAGSNSLKAYDHETVLRVEMTLNDPSPYRSYRPPQGRPEEPESWRVLRRSVADVYRRAQVSQQATERYVAALAAVSEPTPVLALVEPLCARVSEPGPKPGRKVRGLNPLSAEDGALLEAIADPRWMVAGLRNRDLVEALEGKAEVSAEERRRRSGRATRQLRLLRGHGLLRKVPKRNLYQVPAEAWEKLQALLALRRADIKDLTASAA